MACCGGSFTTTNFGRAPAATAAVPPNRAPWKVVYPNGVQAEFDQEWKARQAHAYGGGVLHEPGSHDHADVDTAAEAAYGAATVDDPPDG